MFETAFLFKHPMVTLNIGLTTGIQVQLTLGLMVSQSVCHGVKPCVGLMTTFFKCVSSDDYSVSSHVAPSRMDVIFSLVNIDFHCPVGESFDSIHKFYKVSYINQHFVQGLLSVQAL
jgi:hypothetical protein